MNLIIKAALFAKNAHQGQLRKYTRRPYIEHPMRVAGQTALAGAPEQVVAAAWLHDVLEDCPMQEIHFYAQFGRQKQLVRTVLELTNRSKSPEHADKDRAERKAIDREALADASAWAKIVKLIDRADNLREMHGASGTFKKLYIEESQLLVKALENPNDTQITYYINNVIWSCAELYRDRD